MLARLRAGEDGRVEFKEMRFGGRRKADSALSDAA